MSFLILIHYFHYKEKLPNINTLQTLWSPHWYYDQTYNSIFNIKSEYANKPCRTTATVQQTVSLQIQHQTSDKLRRVICCHRKLITHTNSYRIHCLSHTILNIIIYIKWVQHSNSLSVRSKKATINACQRKTRNTITTETAGNYFPVSHGTRKSGAPTKTLHSGQRRCGQDPHIGNIFPGIQYKVLLLMLLLLLLWCYHHHYHTQIWFFIFSVLFVPVDQWDILLRIPLNWSSPVTVRESYCLWVIVLELSLLFSYARQLEGE